LVFRVEGEAAIDIDTDADVTELEEIIKLVVDKDVAVVFKVGLGVEAVEVPSFVRVVVVTDTAPDAALFC
jgi:hypothetical protein